MSQVACDCRKYGDLPLDLGVINDRVKLYHAMRPALRQIGQKMVLRWAEHYRLYKCDSCGQYWQATLAPRDSDTWYLFKVPQVTSQAWRQSVFVPPDQVAIFVEEQARFLANDFEVGTSHCSTSGCKEAAIVGSVKCIYHQFLQIGGGETLQHLQEMRWFAPYEPEMLQPNYALQRDVHGFASLRRGRP